MATVEKYQTSTGASLYRVRYRTPDRRQPQKRGFTTKRDAELYAATVEVAKARANRRADGRSGHDRRAGPAWLARQRGHLKPASYGAPTVPGGPMSHRAGPPSRVSTVRYTDVAAWVADLSGQRGPVIVRTAHLCSRRSSPTRCATGCWCPTRLTACRCRNARHGATCI